MKRYIIITLTMLFVISSIAYAARSGSRLSGNKKESYTKAKKSKMKLDTADLVLIDKALEGRFSGLTNEEKDRLLEFLSDFSSTASHEQSSGGSNN